MNPVIVIPSRLASTRLPGKPLADIHGKPMIVHVMERAQEATIGPVAVACADPEIAEAVRAAGGRAVMTNPDLATGSDRVFAALAEIDPDGRHDVVVNVQGDFPTVTAAQLRAVVLPLTDPEVDIGTLVTPIASDEEAHTASFVKAACAFDEGQVVAPALYFSREAIPLGEGPRWHHIGIYACRRWRASCCCRLLLWSGGSAWSSCVLWKRGCGLPAHGLITDRSGWIRRRTWSAPGEYWIRSGRRDDDGKNSVSGGAGGVLGPRMQGGLSGQGDVAVRVVRDGDGRRARGARRPGDAAVREQPGGAGAGHPPPAAGVGAVRHR
jgi:3-deoxy-manno-octulosonate cytidylyltransferase (CMP-KDO synthetase)